MTHVNAAENKDFQRIKQLLAVGHKTDGRTKNWDDYYFKDLKKWLHGDTTKDNEELNLEKLAHFEATGETSYTFRDCSSKEKNESFDLAAMRQAMEAGADKEGQQTVKEGKGFLNFMFHTANKAADTFLISRDEVGRINLPWSAAKMAGSIIAAGYFSSAMALGATILGASFPLIVTGGFALATAGMIFNGLNKMNNNRGKFTNEFYDGAADAALGAFGSLGMGTKWIPVVGRVLRFKGELGRALDVSKAGMRQSQLLLENASGIESELKWFGHAGKVYKRILGYFNADMASEIKALRMVEYKMAQAGQQLAHADINAITQNNTIANFIYTNLERIKGNEFKPEDVTMGQVVKLLTDTKLGKFSISGNARLHTDLAHADNVSSIENFIAADRERIGAKSFGGFWNRVKGILGFNHVKPENYASAEIAAINPIAGSPGHYNVILENKQFRSPKWWCQWWWKKPMSVSRQLHIEVPASGGTPINRYFGRGWLQTSTIPAGKETNGDLWFIDNNIHSLCRRYNLNPNDYQFIVQQGKNINNIEYSNVIMVGKNGALQNKTGYFRIGTDNTGRVVSSTPLDDASQLIKQNTTIKPRFINTENPGDAVEGLASTKNLITNEIMAQSSANLVNTSALKAAIPKTLTGRVSKPVRVAAIVDNTNNLPGLLYSVAGTYQGGDGKESCPSTEQDNTGSGGGGFSGAAMSVAPGLGAPTFFSRR